MDSFVRDIYVEEIESQCRLAQGAAVAIDRAVARMGEDGGLEIFRALHSLLTHASNVSKLLWPPGAKPRKGEAKEERKARDGRIKLRGDDLRRLLDLPGRDGGQHVLFDRTLRDHLEHFDERLETWERTSKSRNMIQDAIGPRSAIVAIDPEDAMRWYDPRAEIFYFRHESFSIRDVRNAIEDLLVRAIVSFSDPRNVERKLTEEFPDEVFSWKGMQLALAAALGEDPRFVGIARMTWGPQMRSAEIAIAGNVFQVPLDPMIVPGPKSQIGPIIEKIASAVGVGSPDPP